MSHHEGVSCDSCLKGNFRGKRYKCLICFDYDLCGTCYENGVTSTRHLIDHPLQCILTRTDYELFYGGETIPQEMPQAFTCPYCGKMGYTESNLQEHITTDHVDTSAEVICPICASQTGGEPNNVTDDFATHLALEHRSPRELDSEPQTAIRGRRGPHATRSSGLSSGSRGTRRNPSQYTSSSGLSSLTSPGGSGAGSSGRIDSMDPIAELLSQLSGVRRAANMSQSHSSQLQQLQMQLQLERQNTSGVSVVPSRPGFSSAAPIERVIRRHPGSSSHQQQHLHQQPSVSSGLMAPRGVPPQGMPYVVLMEPSPPSHPASFNPISAQASAAAASGYNSSYSNQSVSGAPIPGSSGGGSSSSRFLLSRCNESNLSESELVAIEVAKADKSLFVQELLLNTLSTNYLSPFDNNNDDDRNNDRRHQSTSAPYGLLFNLESGLDDLKLTEDHLGSDEGLTEDSSRHQPPSDSTVTSSNNSSSLSYSPQVVKSSVEEMPSATPETLDNRPLVPRDNDDEDDDDDPNPESDENDPTLIASVNGAQGLPPFTLNNEVPHPVDNSVQNGSSSTPDKMTTGNGGAASRGSSGQHSVSTTTAEQQNSSNSSRNREPTGPFQLHSNHGPQATPSFNYNGVPRSTQRRNVNDVHPSNRSSTGQSRVDNRTGGVGNPNLPGTVVKRTLGQSQSSQESSS